MSTGKWKRNKGVNMDVLKKIIKEQVAGRRAAICPTTNNLPTRMTEPAFRRRCAEHQQEEGGYCQTVCHGETLPAGLEFIDLKNINSEENAMSVKPGVCDICKQAKNLKSIHGKKCCATDEPIWREANNHPERLVSCLVDAHGQEWIGRNFGAVVNVADATFKDDLERSENDNDKLRKELQTVVADLAAIKQEKDNLSANYDHLEHYLKNLREAVLTELGAPVTGELNIATEVSILKQENNRLREQLEEATVELEATEYTTHLGKIVTRDTALLDLALKILDNNLTGIDSSLIRALR